MNEAASGDRRGFMLYKMKLLLYEKSGNARIVVLDCGLHAEEGKRPEIIGKILVLQEIVLLYALGLKAAILLVHLTHGLLPPFICWREYSPFAAQNQEAFPPKIVQVE